MGKLTHRWKKVAATVVGGPFVVIHAEHAFDAIVDEILLGFFALYPDHFFEATISIGSTLFDSGWLTHTHFGIFDLLLFNTYPQMVCLFCFLFRFSD